MGRGHNCVFRKIILSKTKSVLLSIIRNPVKKFEKVDFLIGPKAILANSMFKIIVDNSPIRHLIRNFIPKNVWLNFVLKKLISDEM